MSPDDIKSAIIDSFSNYFQNSSILNDYAISHLTETWLAHITVYRENPESLCHIDSILRLFNEAKQVNQEEAIKAYNSWFSDISQSISRFWSLYNNQQDMKKLCIEDFTEEALRVIGQSIEGLSKPFLKLLLQINRIRRGKPFDLEEIKRPWSCN